MLKRFSLLTLVLCTAGTAALAQAAREPSDAGKYVINLFTQMNAAIAYDDICNKARAINDEKGSFYNNISLIADITAASLRRDNPHAGDDDVNKLLQTNGKAVHEAARKVINEKGCTSDEAKNAQSTLKFLTETKPEGVTDFVEAELRKIAAPQSTAPQ